MNTHSADHVQQALQGDKPTLEQRWKDFQKPYQINRYHFMGINQVEVDFSISIGKLYMQGEIDITDVQEFLTHMAIMWPFDGFLKAAKLVRKGTELAENPLPSRVQPIQDQETLEVCKKKKKNVKKQQLLAA